MGLLEKFTLSVLVLLSSCVTPKAVSDLEPSAADASYPSAMFVACGRVWNGVGICQLKPGVQYADVGLKVYVYNKGTVYVTGKECGVDDKRTYSKSGDIEYRPEGEAKKSCLLSFVVSPEYPEEVVGDGLKVGSMTGHLFIKVEESESWRGSADKVQAGESIDLKLPVNQEKPRVVIERCGEGNVDSIRPIDNGMIVIGSKEIVDPGRSLCVLHGAVMAPDKKYKFSWVVASYDGRFSVLPKPVVEVGEDEISVLADQKVAVMGYNGVYKSGHESDFSFNPKATGVLTLITVGGRTMLGEWSPEQGQWVWWE